ncbi:MAG: MBL fold metallo-hydrolase [Elusimicrobiales bacterium]
MKLAVLYDNPPAPEGYACGHGFSCLVDGWLLFDTGPDYASLENNLQKSGADAGLIKEVFISHEHADHAGGLAGLLERGRIRRVHVPAGTGEELRRLISARAELVEYVGPGPLGGNCFSTGAAAFEYKGRRLAEHSLVVRTGAGLALITGCAHTGVENTVRSVLETFPGERVGLIAGGFHLRDKTAEEIAAVAAALRAAGVFKVAPCHCTGAAAAEDLAGVYGKNFLKISPGFSGDF